MYCPSDCLAVLSEGVTVRRLQHQAAVRPAAATGLPYFCSVFVYLAAACWANYQLGVAAHELDCATAELYCTVGQVESAV